MMTSKIFASYKKGIFFYHDFSEVCIIRKCLRRLALSALTLERLFDDCLSLLIAAYFMKGFLLYNRSIAKLFGIANVEFTSTSLN